MKKVSRTVLSLTLGVLMCVAVAGCGKDKDGDDDSPENFTHGGHSYLIVKQTKTWADAAADAVSKGGYLAEIGSKAEQDAIWAVIQKAGIAADYAKATDGGGTGYIWIGATDRYQENTWVWNGANRSGNVPVFWFGNQTGSAAGGSYTNWGGTSAGKPNEPDNYTDPGYSPNGQNAAAIGLANWPAGASASSALGKAGEWNDIAETNKMYYLVEFDD